MGEITKAVAEAKLAERKRQVRLDQLDMIGVEVTTLSEFLEKYIKYIRDVKQNRSWKTSVYHLNRLRKFFGDKKLTQISSRNIDDYKLVRLRNVKPAMLP